MGFFSKLRMAKGAAQEHKKAASVQEEPKPKVAYKHVPRHAAQDAMSSAPTTAGAHDLRARIADARKNMAAVPVPTLAKSRSMQGLNTPASSSRSNGSTLGKSRSMYGLNTASSSSRPDNIPSPSHNRASSFGGRPSGDLSIGSVMESNSAQPLQRDYFSQPLKSTMTSSSAYRPRGYPTGSSRSSMKTKRRSPLAAVIIDEEDESDPCPGETPVFDRSVASSQSSATDYSRPSSTHGDAPEVSKAVAMPLPNEKFDSAVEVQSAPKQKGTKRSRSMWSLFGR